MKDLKILTKIDYINLKKHLILKTYKDFNILGNTDKLLKDLDAMSKLGDDIFNHGVKADNIKKEVKAMCGYKANFWVMTMDDKLYMECEVI